MGFRTWRDKLLYAESVVRFAASYAAAGEERVGVCDFWRALTNFGLLREGRGELIDGEVDTQTNLRLPGSGLPGAKEFGKGVFTDRLHLGEMGYRVLSNEVMKVMGDKWPELL